MPRVIEISRIFRRRAMTFLGVVVLACFALLLVVPRAHAQSEDQIIAAFLFNFARYVEWPKDAFDPVDMPLNICILGSREFGDVVSRTVSGKTVGDRRVAFQQTTDLSNVSGCHILFIGGESSISHAEAITALRGLSIFSVSDREGFASAGGTANFIRTDNRIRFEINPGAATRAGLKISSRLLRLAKVVD